MVNYREFFPGIAKNIDKENTDVITMVLKTPNRFKWSEKSHQIWRVNDSILLIIVEFHKKLNIFTESDCLHLQFLLLYHSAIPFHILFNYSLLYDIRQ